MNDNHIGRGRIRAAVLVDFDNILSGLIRVDPQFAKQFAAHPSEWLTRIESALIVPGIANGNSLQRSILARYCYLNPRGLGGHYRHAFLSAGFKILDCPPVTGQGKNCADIKLVIDALELLRHPTHFDEFIVMSGDADFLPLLVHLREHERLTTIVFAGPAASAYRTAADLAIDARTFCDLALSPLACPAELGTNQAA